MKKTLLPLLSLIITFIGLILLLTNCTFLLNDTGQRTRLMSTSGTNIFDENGREFIIKAINTGSGGYDPDAPDLENPVWYSSPYLKMKEDDYKEIAALGFNTVRLCMDYKHFYFDAWTWDNPLPTATTPVSYDPGVNAIHAWNYIRDNIRWAKKYGIKVIPNLHSPPGGYQSTGLGEGFWTGDYIKGEFKGADYFQDLFVKFWVEFASRFANESAILGYGLLNEPVPIITLHASMSQAEILAEVQKAVDRYDALMERTIKAIRRVDPNHIIVVEKILYCWDPDSDSQGYYSPSDSGGLGHIFTVLNFPNILYEYHLYSNFNLQYAAKSIDSPLYYSTAADWLNFKQIIDSRIAWSNANNRPVFLGEYGTTRFTSEMELTLLNGSIIQHDLGGEIFLNDILKYITEKRHNSAYFQWKESLPDGLGLYEQYHWSWKGIPSNTRAIPNTAFIDLFKKYFLNVLR